LIRGWREARTPPEEIARQIEAMSERELKTLEAVAAGMLAGERAVMTILEDPNCWLVRARAAGSA
jgi:hypothetical protein